MSRKSFFHSLIPLFRGLHFVGHPISSIWYGVQVEIAKPLSKEGLQVSIV